MGERSVSDVTQRSEGTTPAFAIVDAHQHFWDPARNYYPWLNDEPPIPFRYGDYRRDPPPLSAARLPRRCRARIASTRRSTSRPNGIRAIRSARRAMSHDAAPRARPADAWPWRRRGSTATTRRACSSSRRRSRSCAASATSRAPTRRPATRRRAARPIAKWRAGFARARAARPALRPADAVVASCAKRRGSPPTIPDTQIILNHTGLPADRSAEGIAGWKRAMATLARVPERRA